MMKKVIGLLMVVIIFLIAWFGYFGETQINPVTGKKQHISLTQEQEIQLGLQCAPQLAAQFGGLYKDRAVQANVKNIGTRLTKSTEADRLPYQFDFHILAETQHINAFALPGGQIFITFGLLKNLNTDSEIAAILSHEIGHVIGRHASERLKEVDWIREVSGKAIAAKRYNINEKTARSVTELVNLDYEKSDELESDEVAVRYMTTAGYEPEALPAVLKRFDEKSKELNATDLLERHPISENRLENLNRNIRNTAKRR